MSEYIISRQLEQFIKYRRNIGFKDKSTNTFLLGFIKYLEDTGYSGHLNWKIVKEYCELIPGSKAKSRGRRFESLISFSKYVNAIDSESEKLPKLPYGKCHARPRPHIYIQNKR